MQERSVTHSTFVIERNYPVSPERVFAAFADPAKKRLWFAEGEGFKILGYQLDFRVGGTEVTRFEFQPGAACRNDTVFMDIVPNRRIVFAYSMSMGDKPFSSSQSTVELLPDGKGTTFLYTEQAAFFENSDGPKMREEGWTKLFEQMEKSLGC